MRRDDGSTRIMSWSQAYAFAHVFAHMDKCRMRVMGYRTGVPSRPWGYSFEPTRERSRHE